MGLACFGHLIAVKVGKRLTTFCRRFTLGHWRPVTLTAVTSSQEPILSAVPAAFTVRRTSETAGSRSTTVLYKRMFGRWRSIQMATFLQEHTLAAAFSDRRTMATVGHQ